MRKRRNGSGTDRIDCEAADRVRRMELCFDAVQSAMDAGGHESDEEFIANVQELSEYYESGLWLKDYELDEKGLLPPGLNRGVLSQDAVYDLLKQLDRMRGKHAMR